MSDQFTEIERKFLIESFPNNLTIKQAFDVYQAYLSTDPEVRIRRNSVNGKDIAYYLAIKTSGGMVRREVKMVLTPEQFFALADTVQHPFIKKEFKIYELPNGLELECNLVDEGTSTGFMYAEVEFPSVEEAESFTPCFDYVAEVTHCTDYKMKNYWKRTRLGGRM